MEEGWKEKTRASNTRIRIGDALLLYSNTLKLYIWQFVRALVSSGSDAEAHLRKIVLGHGEKGLSDHERRKHKHSKLKQIITPLRPGRLGYVILLFAAVAMLAFATQDTSIHHVEKEFERAMATQANKARVEELTFNRKERVGREAKHLVSEVGTAPTISEDQPEVFRNILGSERSSEDSLSSKVETADQVHLTGVIGTVNADDTVVKQDVQAETRKGIEDKWPQESAQISSLRQRAAVGTLKVGLLNLKLPADIGEWKFLAGRSPITIPFERVAETVGWIHLFPDWIDEEAKYGTQKCPTYPMPAIPAIPYVRPTVNLDVVIARAPCAEPSTLQEGWKHPAILQVLLGAAHIAVGTGHDSIYVLILSKCRPLVNLFSCGELVEHRGEGWLYHMNVEQLKKRTSLPIGSCQLSVRLSNEFDVSDHASDSRKEAYATILHSGEDFVCGAIAVAQSIRRTGSTRDLVALVDNSIAPEHRIGLEEAGWKVRDYVKINSSSSLGKQKDFSVFRLWQLDYDKVIYLESDIIILRNIDHLFKLPEVSASGTTQSVFNAGVMVVEPSNCTFQILMDEMEKLVSEVIDDWDFFNRVFPWWHRIPRNMNTLKHLWNREKEAVDYMTRLFSADPPELYAIHYASGQKPWKCFRDYDCNWNINEHYASDEAHAQWFKVYDQMPENLQKYCALPTGARADLEYHRRVAQSGDMPDKHWAINITDPRLNVCQGNHCDLKLCEQNHCDWNAMVKTVNSLRAVNATSQVVASVK